MTTPGLRVPRLGGRSAWVWFLGTLVVSLSVAGVLVAQDPDRLLPAAIGVAVVLAGAALVLSDRTWVDPEAGSITWRRFGVRRTVMLRDADTVNVGGAGPSVLLTVRARRHGGHVLLLMLGDYVGRSQGVEILTALADALERHTPERLHRSAVDQLRAQARHVAAGGGPEASPLARLARPWLLRRGRAVGGR